MEDCLWYHHDSSAVSPEEVKAVEDSILNFYDMAIKYFPDAMAYFQVRKAFVSESWLKVDARELPYLNIKELPSTIPKWTRIITIDSVNYTLQI